MIQICMCYDYWIGGKLILLVGGKYLFLIFFLDQRQVIEVVFGNKVDVDVVVCFVQVVFEDW